MFAICAGMLRSGSTFQYQIVSHLVETIHGGKRLGFMGLDCVSEIRQEVLDYRWRVIKVHEPHAFFSGLLDEGRAKCFYTYRDVRDVMYSLMHRLGLGFDEIFRHAALAAGPNDEFWRSQPHTLVQRYEELVGDSTAAIRSIAEHLGIALSEPDAANLASLYSIEANR